MISRGVSRCSCNVPPLSGKHALAHLQTVSQSPRARPAFWREVRYKRYAERPMALTHKDWLLQASRGVLEPLPAVLLALALLACPGAASAATALQGPAHVVDGDTIVVAGERIRLFGLDAPEKAQVCQDKHGKGYLCGMAAKKALENRIEHKPVTCEVRNRDMYGRNVSKCTLDGKGDIGHWLVSSGHAIAYRQYSKEYVKDEEHAHDAHRGIWAGYFEVPADWRREHKGKHDVKAGKKATHVSKKHAKDLCSKFGLHFSWWGK